MFVPLLFTFIFLPKCEGVISDLSESEYYRMPPLYGLDEYRPCLVEPAGLYCVVDATLHAEEGNKLIKMIQEYSAVTTKHFNHTKIHRGVCVTRTCQKFTGDQDLNIPRERDLVIERCLNQSITKEFGLQAKLAKVLYCNRHGSEPEVDKLTTCVKNIYILIIFLSIIGTVYDRLYKKKGKLGKDNGTESFVRESDSHLADPLTDTTGNPYLLAFSISRNWTNLTASSGRTDPRLNRLTSLNGIRSVMMILVIFSHAELIVAAMYMQNPWNFEMGYNDSLLKQGIRNGVFFVQSFVVMSSFLLSYNMEILAEEKKLSFTNLPKIVLLRWLRLSPPYALVLATAAVYSRFLQSGPLRDLLTGREVATCRQYWWAHLLYVQNYITDDAYCLPHTWYLAVDMQLFCVGLLICVWARSSRARSLTLSLFFLLSLVIVAAHTYYQDLDGVVLQSPENFRTVYAHDDTFRQVFIRGHTNLSSHILGLAAGFWAFNLQKVKNIEQKYKKYRWAVWSLLSSAIALTFTGNCFYLDEGRPSLVFRVLYATFCKCIFVFLLLAFILSSMFKIESLYRGFMEWRGFTWMARVTYNAYLVHTIFQKALIGGAVSPVHVSASFSLMFFTSSIMTSFGFGALMYIFVEAPVAAITREVFRGEEKMPIEDNENSDKVSNKTEKMKRN